MSDIKPEPKDKPRPHWQATHFWGSIWKVEQKLWGPNPGCWYWGNAICECSNEEDAQLIAILLERRVHTYDIESTYPSPNQHQGQPSQDPGAPPEAGPDEGVL